ncbi:MAG: beta-propeller fold lactonase family protein [Lachnospiraceae bacterium]|nr:beta-propeller fold lactonase family protein [Lachnospiraceae bacterium]
MSQEKEANERYVAYVGTYTHENSLGIHLYDLDIEKARMTERKVIPINNPSDLVISKNQKYLYSIADEGVQAFRIQPDGDLLPINNKWIGGMRGCYVEVDDENRYLFVGGYYDARVTMMRLDPETGEILGIADGIFHKGMSRNVAQRNFVPHVTCVKLTPDQKFLCAVDSGLDQVKFYRIDYEEGKLILVDILRCNMESGPRMIRFSKNGKFAYILHELSDVIEVFTYTGTKKIPELERIQTVPTNTEKDPEHVCAASGIEISSSGNIMICTNAGLNSAAVFSVNQETGELTRICENKISGDYPKMLGIYPNEKYFMSLNHETNEITTMRLNYEEGYFLMEAKPVPIEKPNCVDIYKLP